LPEPYLHLGVADVKLTKIPFADMGAEQLLDRQWLVVGQRLQLELTPPQPRGVVQVQRLEPDHLHVVLVGERAERPLEDVEVERRVSRHDEAAEGRPAEGLQEGSDARPRPQVGGEQDGAVLGVVHEQHRQRRADIRELLPHAGPDELAAAVTPLIVLTAEEVASHVRAAIDDACAAAVVMAEQQSGDAYGRMREQAAYEDRRSRPIEEW
jgi:hypothetical protein